MTNAKFLLKNQISADELVEKLLGLSQTETICLLDSGGVSYLNSHYLFCGVNPLEIFEISHRNPEKTLAFLDEKLNNPETFAIFTIAYDFGLKLEKIKPRKKKFAQVEPDVFLAIFDCLIIHDYISGKTYLTGNEKRFESLENLLFSSKKPQFSAPIESTLVKSNFTKAEYLAKIEEIKEFIRRGDTYQTNLTQQFIADLPKGLSPQQIFHKLRKHHPAPFSSFIQRPDSTVISASPERFFRVKSPFANRHSPISTSPIKGTRPRGKTPEEDERLKNELLDSEKDRAENVMIVDLLRNDLGRICEFGSVRVEKLCELEEHPTFFHLVSTVKGNLRPQTKFSEMIRAVFPCGSITGAPKIRTMRIIDALETATRGLSMGAIGISTPKSIFFNQTSDSPLSTFELSVAIRTMVIKNHKATFNVGGGIVIDSLPEAEYEESLTKAKALLYSINAKFK